MDLMGTTSSRIRLNISRTEARSLIPVLLFPPWALVCYAMLPAADKRKRTRVSVAPIPAEEGGGGKPKAMLRSFYYTQ